MARCIKLAFYGLLIDLLRQQNVTPGVVYTGAVANGQVRQKIHKIIFNWIIIIQL